MLYVIFFFQIGHFGFVCNVYFLLFFCFWIYRCIIISHRTAKAHLLESASDYFLGLVLVSLSIHKSVNSFRLTALFPGMLLALQSKLLSTNNSI